MKRVSLLLVYCSFFLASFSQIPKTYTSSEILQQIKKLKVLGSVLYVAAHPDDENTRLIAWLANEKQYRTGYLSMTRGDGGQNLIGDEQGVELGLIRTQELLSARRIDGGEQFFTRAYDFGFSKSTEEALKTWDKEKILGDVVWVIRNFQPDVIITRFPPDNRAGHGHHSASAVLANEAFDAAADPNRFAEQFQYGVKPWQAKRILWNTFNFGSTNTTDSTQFTIDAGGYNPLLGKSYGELAGESRSQHKSQGFGVPRSRGSQLEYFSTTKGDKPAKELTDGSDVSWEKIPGGAKIDQMINKLITSYNLQQPDQSLPGLIAILKEVQKLPASHWTGIKESEVKNIIKLAAGIYAEATTSSAYVCQGDSLKTNINVINRSSLPVVLRSAFIATPAEVLQTRKVNNIDKELAYNKPYNNSFVKWIDPASIPITQPYWLENEKRFGSYDVEDQKKIGRADASPAFVLYGVISVGGVDISISEPVKYKFNDPVKGEQYQPVAVIPPVEIQFNQDNYIGLNEKPVSVVTSVKSNCSDTSSYVFIKRIPDNWATNYGSFTYASRGRQAMQDSGTYAPKPNTLNSSSSLAFQSNTAFTGYKRVIQYDHIPAITYFKKAVTHLLNLDIKTGGKNIGYIAGAGDKVAEDLSELGYVVTMLDAHDINNQNLLRFDAIVTGVRAYNIHQWLTEKYDVLMAYVQEGGNLVVQYNTNSNVGPLRAKIAPFPMNISRTRITDETAAVSFPVPAHPVLNFPNKITAKDFEEWVQERSIYHADQLDPKFVAPISMADPGETASNGALVIAPYGKGNFVYTGLVFFRELPAGVPGAYRLMANILALPKH